MIDTIAANIYPKIPREGIVKLDKETAQRFKEGISVTIYSESEIDVGGFNEGQPRLMHDFLTRCSQLTMPPIWALAHLYLENDEMINFTKMDEISTSSAREIKKNLAYIGHSIQPRPGYDDYLRDSHKDFVVGKEGLLITIDKKQYPKSDMPFVDFLDQHRIVAKAILLMDDYQIDRLKERLPKYRYDPDGPLVQGVSFCDGTFSKRAEPLVFGGHCEKEDNRSYFGITSSQRIPVHSYPIKVGKQDEIGRTYTPQQSLEIFQAFRRMKEKPTKSNILELERRLYLESSK